MQPIAARQEWPFVVAQADSKLSSVPSWKDHHNREWGLIVVGRARAVRYRHNHSVHSRQRLQRHVQLFRIMAFGTWRLILTHWAGTAWQTRLVSFNSGRTKATARRPVVVGIIDSVFAPPTQVIMGQVQDLLVIGVAMCGRHYFANRTMVQTLATGPGSWWCKA